MVRFTPLLLAAAAVFAKPLKRTPVSKASLAAFAANSWRSIDSLGYGPQPEQFDNLAVLDWITRNGLHTFLEGVDENVPIKIPVNIFLIGTEKQKKQLNSTAAPLRIEEALIKNYGPHNFHFGPFTRHNVAESRLGKLDHARQRANATLKMKRALRRGGPETLNVYLVPELSGSVMGYSTVPHELLPMPNPWALAMDGVVLRHTVLGSYVAEKTVVHEVGHFLGLQHPFKGGCKVENGDEVEDTTQMSDEPGVMRGCNDELNSCPELPGLDLVRNWMTYTSCTNNNSFTPGQVRRMRETWYSFRDPNTRKLPPETENSLPALSESEANALIQEALAGIPE